MNQRYRSTAALPEGAEEPRYERDPEMYFQATTWPGARLPHVWLERDRQRLSSLDLCGAGRFTLLTGIGGEAWRDAAAAVATRFALPIAVYTIGPAGCDVQDIYADWSRISEIDEDGCLLVRPDMHVAWRSIAMRREPVDALEQAVAALLGWSVVVPTAPQRVAA